MDDELANVTEKELLLEIFRETRALRRMVFWWFIALPVAAVIVGMWAAFS